MKSLILSLIFSASTVFAALPADLEPDYKGGHLRMRLGAWPKGLNDLTTNAVQLRTMWSFAGVRLGVLDFETWEVLPYLAESWEKKPDNKTFVFKLVKNATWFDGKPITAEDVKWTIDTVWDNKKCVLCEPIRNYNGPTSAKIIDKHTVEIKVDRVHFDNFGRLAAGVWILPKHIYGSGKNFDKGYNKRIWGGGPYVWNKKKSKYRKRVVLDRRKNYWGNVHPHIRKRFNFDRITMKYIEDVNVAFEAFKRKELDIFYFEIDTFKFLNNRKAAPFTDSNLGVVQFPKANPGNWRGVALNMRKGVLADKTVRKALQHMFNRDLVMNKIYKGYLVPVSGPFMKGSKYSSNSPAVPYDLKKASALLKKAGFVKAGPDGILYREIEENGKKIKQRAATEFLYSRKNHDQWLTVLKEDAKKVGFEVKPRFVEWSAALKLLDEFKFGGFVIQWVGDPVPGPQQLFHGRSAYSKSSSNIPGLNNPKINEMIDAAPATFNEKKRVKLFQDLERKIIDEQPYLFAWTEGQHNVAYWKDKVNPTDTPMYKFSGNMYRHPFYFHWQKAK